VLTIDVWQSASVKLQETILSKTENVIFDLKKNLEERIGLKFSEMSAVNEERQEDSRLRGNRIEEE
jgi:hypothetical protein